MQIVLVYLEWFRRNSLLKCVSHPENAKNSLRHFLGSSLSTLGSRPWVQGFKPTSFCRRRRAGCLRPAAAAFDGVTGQLLLMLNLNHTNEQEDKPEKFS